MVSIELAESQLRVTGSTHSPRWAVRVGRDTGDLRPWHFIHVYSIERGPTMRFRYQLAIRTGFVPNRVGQLIQVDSAPEKNQGFHLRLDAVPCSAAGRGSHFIFVKRFSGSLVAYEDRWIL